MLTDPGRARTRLARLAILMLLAPAAALAQRDDADARRLIEQLAIRPGMHVAEIGAGTGELTVAIAQQVGASGHVFSNEIDKARHATIRAAVKAAGLSNVTVVESAAADANLPAACCEAIFMRNVYHHFDDPATMVASLFRSLTPGGRIAVIDFPPRGGKEAASAKDRDQGNAHGVTTDSIERELRGAGFDIVVSEQPTDGRWFMVVGRRLPR